MIDKKIAGQFTVVTFILAYTTAGILIFFGQFGYRVYNFTNKMCIRDRYTETQELGHT